MTASARRDDEMSIKTKQDTCMSAMARELISADDTQSVADLPRGCCSPRVHHNPLPQNRVQPYTRDTRGTRDLQSCSYERQRQP
jgi:hypothetical protein